MPAPTRRLRVGIVTDGLEERLHDGRATIANGGVGVYIAQLIANLAAYPECELVLIRHGTARLDIFHDARVRTVMLPPSSSARLARALDRPYARLARELQLDLIHYPNQFGGAFLPPTIRRVVTLHDITPLLFPTFHPWKSVVGYRLLLRPSIRAADRVIVDATNTGADLERHRITDTSHVTVIPLGVAECFRPGVRSESFAHRYHFPRPFVLSVGVFEPRKNHHVLLAVLDRLHQRGDDVDLVLCGRDGWRWRDPLDDPAYAHLRARLHVLRNVPDADLPELYGRAAAFAYPSLYEGFGLPVLEAMACGTPVVASNRSSIPEVAGSAARLVDPTDVVALAEQLHQVVNDGALRQRLIADGLAWARTFTWQRTAERTLAVYHQVVSAR
jgi:glycosyltransferase involved in cell wall biosynthesis